MNAGRETEEAKIFESTFESNMEAKNVVSLYFKAVMILLIVGLNIYFVYISIMYCSDKSYGWQLNWLCTFLTVSYVTTTIITINSNTIIIEFFH